MKFSVLQVFEFIRKTRLLINAGKNKAAAWIVRGLSGTRRDLSVIFSVGSRTTNMAHTGVNTLAATAPHVQGPAGRDADGASGLGLHGTLHGAGATRWVAQVIAASGTDRIALAAALRTSRMVHNRDVWTALQQQLGNEQATQVMMAASNPATGMSSTVPSTVPGTAAGGEAHAATATTSVATGAGAPVGPAAAVGAVLAEPMHREVFGVRITAAAGCHPESLERAATIVRQMIGRNVYAQRRLAEAQLTFVIIPADRAMTSLPEFAGLIGQTTFDNRPWEDVRGVGKQATSDGRVAIAAGEETLINVPSTRSNYPAGYSVGQHEFAHVLHLDGMTDAQRARVTALFAARQAAAVSAPTTTWSDAYAASNEREYFAQASNVFFGTNQMGSNANGRAWLQANDPNMYTFLVELYERAHDRRGRVTND